MGRSTVLVNVFVTSLLASSATSVKEDLKGGEQQLEVKMGFRCGQYVSLFTYIYIYIYIFLDLIHWDALAGCYSVSSSVVVLV